MNESFDTSTDSLKTFFLDRLRPQVQPPFRANVGCRVDNVSVVLEYARQDSNLRPTV